MPENNFTTDDEIIDLTELIETGESATPKTGAAAYARQANVSPAVEFDDILSNAASESARPERPFDPDEELDMSGMGEIDNLLDSLDIPAQPGTPASASAQRAQPEKATSEELGLADLDSVLDDILGPSEKPEKKTTEKADEPSIDNDLDAILGELDDKPSAKAEPADNLELNADLDSILAEMEPEKTPPSEEIVPESASESFDLPDNLDELIPAGEAEPEKDDASFETPPEPVAMTDQEMQKNEISEVSAASEKPPVYGVSDYMPEQPPMPPMQGQNYPPELVSSICSNILGSQALDINERLQDFAGKIGSLSAHIENLNQKVNDIARHMQANEAKIASLRTRVSGLEKEAGKQMRIEELLTEGTPLHTGLQSLLATAVTNSLQSLPLQQKISGNSQEEITAKLADIFARLDSIDNQIDVLSQGNMDGQEITARLDDLDAKYSNAESRLEELANRVETQPAEDFGAQIARLEELQSQDAAKYEELQARIKDASGAGAKLQEHLEETSTREAEIQNRLETIEQRLDELAGGSSTSEFASQLEGMSNQITDNQLLLEKLENRIEEFDKKFAAAVEKAAASAVANILHEEISRLLASE